MLSMLAGLMVRACIGTFPSCLNGVEAMQATTSPYTVMDPSRSTASPSLMSPLDAKASDSATCLSSMWCIAPNGSYLKASLATIASCSGITSQDIAAGPLVQ